MLKEYMKHFNLLLELTIVKNWLMQVFDNFLLILSYLHCITIPE